jgi:hypothetical protein
MEPVSQRKLWLRGVALGLLLLVGSLLAYYMGDQTGRVAETTVSFTIDTRDPDSIVLALSLSQDEQTSASFTIDTRDADAVVLALSIAQDEQTSASFTIDTRDPDAVVLALSVAQSEDTSSAFIIDTMATDPPTWAESSLAFTIDTRDPDSLVLALSIAQAEVSSIGFIIDTRDPLPLDSDNDGIHDFWENMYFGGIFAQNADGDPDGDGLDNFAEFAFGTDPTKPDNIANGPSSINVAIQLTQVNGTWVLTLSYPRHVLAAQSVRYAYEVASDVAGPWVDTTAVWTEVGDPVTLNGYVERVTVSMPLASKPAQIFVRVQAYRK